MWSSPLDLCQRGVVITFAATRVSGSLTAFTNSTLPASVADGTDPIPVGTWWVTITIVVALLVLDFLVASRRPHAVGMAEASFWSVLYVGVALAFGAWVWFQLGSVPGQEYLAGWIVEKSLSIDNLFVFLVIFGRFAVPAQYRQKVLLFGIALALVLRAIFIALGAALIETFAITFLFFGLLLLWTAISLFRHRDEDPDPADNKLTAWAARRLPATTEYIDNKLIATVDGRRVITPLFLVFLAIGTTDIVFALDSIPAVYGVTDDPFLVFSANAFALLGLRALFFLLQGLLSRLIYLSTGLSVILAFIGVKLVLHWAHKIWDTVPEIPISVSLAVILAVLVVTTVLSLWASNRHPELVAHSGALRGHEAAPVRNGGNGDSTTEMGDESGAAAGPAPLLDRTSERTPENG